MTTLRDLTLAAVLGIGWGGIANAAEPESTSTDEGTKRPPNILWITCEDTSPHLGSYGDGFAATPNLDAFARQGVRYTSAFAYTGVCAPSRSNLITGVYPLRLGSQHMRSTTRLPGSIKLFTEYLREAGYYCSNNSKEDYNFRRNLRKTVWPKTRLSFSSGTTAQACRE